MTKNTICIWYDKDAEAAARFIPRPFPAAWWAPSTAHPVTTHRQERDVLTVEFKVAGVSCIGLNGGPTFKHSEAFWFQIATDDQSENAAR